MDIVLGRREIASIFFKNIRRLLITFLSVFLLAIVASLIMTPTFKAETEILVQSGREFAIPTEKGELAPTGAPMLTQDQVVNSEVEILSGRDLAESVIESIGLARMYPTIAEDGVLVRIGLLGPPTNGERMDKAVRKFTKHMKINPVAESNTIAIDFWHEDRDIAIQALQRFSATYQQKHVELFGNKGSEVLGQQTTGYEKRLEDVTQKITLLKNSQHLSDIAYEREQLIQDRSDVDAKMRELKAQSIDAHRTLDYYKQRLASMPEMIITNQNSADAVETAKARLLDLNTQLLTMKQRYIESDPDAANAMANLKDQIAQIKAFMSDPSVDQQNTLGRNLTYDDARLKSQTAEAVISSVDQELAFETAEEQKIANRLQVLDDGEASLEIMSRDQSNLRELVHDSSGRYEAARMSGDMDKQNLISVSIMHAPEANERADKPKHLLFAAVGFVGGLFGAAGALLYLLIVRESIITPESLARTLNLRVLASVPDVA